MSTSSLRGTSGMQSTPPNDSSATTVYDGGVGGKNANLAAMDDVTPPIFVTVPLHVAAQYMSCTIHKESWCFSVI